MEDYRNIDELISKFKDGKDRYRNSAVFHQVINSLAHGSDPLDIIDQLMNMNEGYQKALERYVMLNGAPPFNIPLDEN